MMLARATARSTAARFAATAAALLAFFSAESSVSLTAQQHFVQQPRKHTRSPAPATRGVSVVMLSDIHFEPFQDPSKVSRLREAPVEQWPAILNAPASPTQASDFQALQKACPVRGVDTSWPLLSGSLASAAATQGNPLFVTVSGDFLAHEFDCRFKALAPAATSQDLSAFAAKTVAFVTAQLRRAFPSSPVYLALGNNDSGCTDYHEDPNSAFLQQTAQAFAAAARSGHNGQAILREFSQQGDYNIELPAPMEHARLIVLQDLFDARTYKSCGGQPDAAAQDAQMEWLHTQLAHAAEHGERVWVMAHIPPGVDVYNTLKSRKVCAGELPVMFLSSERLVDELTQFAPAVSLAIFAHTHGDELRLLHAAGGSRSGNPGAEVVAKLVASISPVNGNQPTFTVAKVDPHTATLLDYTVYMGDSAHPARPFAEEYTFSKIYGLPDFSARSIDRLATEFAEHKNGDSPRIASYAHFAFPGDTGYHAAAIQLLWNNYTCILTEDRPETYRSCACPAAPASQPQ